MAYDRELAERIRGALADRSDVREVAMFGGLSFMVNGRLAIAATTHGELMVRLDPARVDGLTGARPATMNGRPMSKGWVIVTDRDNLDHWLDLALNPR